MAYQHQQSGWSRTRWFVVGAVLVGLAVLIILALAYSGGGSGSSSY